MLGVISLSVLVVVYITWLRRFSFGWSNTATDQHIQRLQKQIESNIKIANLSLHSIWFVVLLMVVLHVGLYYFEVFPPDRLIRKVLITFAINAVALPCIWVWASKRKKRFSRELLELNHLLEGSKV
jgi:Flp pilus assembly protein TadB